MNLSKTIFSRHHRLLPLVARLFGLAALPDARVHAEPAAKPQVWGEFAPYFQLIHRHENVKAFCYINQDWDSIGTWKGWGDSRLSQNAEIRKKFQEQIGAAMFLHGADREQTLKALHVKE